MIFGGPTFFDQLTGESAFRDHCDGNFDHLKLSDALDLFLGFYRSAKPKHALSSRRSGDILSFEWGNIEYDSGLKFEVRLSRVIRFSERSRKALSDWRLSVAYFYQPDPTLLSIKPGETACDAGVHLDGYRGLVLNSAAVIRCSKRKHMQSELTWEPTLVA